MITLINNVFRLLKINSKKKNVASLKDFAVAAVIILKKREIIDYKIFKF